MDEKIDRAILAQLTAQTALLGVIARYYGSLRDRDLVDRIPGRTLDELRAIAPEVAAMAERIGAEDAKAA